jgi:beta-hydroxylase
MTGQFAGSPDDLRDGFVHLSGGDQLARTAAKFFTGRSDLELLTIDPARLGAGLCWESSAGGTLYPHFYGPLPIAAVVASAPLSVGPDGRHILPPELG